MKIRSIVAVSAAFIGLCVSTHVYAAPLSAIAPVHALFGKPKTVRFNLRNDTGTPLELKVGETVMTVDAGKTVAMKLPVGTRILTNATTSKHQAGEVLAKVSPQIEDATLGIH